MAIEPDEELVAMDEAARGFFLAFLAGKARIEINALKSRLEVGEARADGLASGFSIRLVTDSEPESGT